MRTFSHASTMRVGKLAAALLVLVLPAAMGLTLATLPYPNVWELIRATEDLTVTESVISQFPYLQLALMDHTLKATLFLPINGAWGNGTARDTVISLLKNMSPALSTNRDFLTSVARSTWLALNNHIVLDVLYSDMFKTGTSVDTAFERASNSLDVTVAGKTVILSTSTSTANVTSADQEAGKSVVHLINSVLIPDTTSGDKFDTLLKYLDPDPSDAFYQIIKASALFNTFRATILTTGPYTVLLPYSEAIDSYLSDKGLTLPQLLANSSLCTSIVRAHVIQGAALWIWDLQLLGTIGTSKTSPPTFLNGKPLQVTSGLDGTVSVTVGKTVGSVDNSLLAIGGNAFGCTKLAANGACTDHGSVFHFIDAILA